MKKVKKLLVTAIAALSLTACSFEDVKGYAVTAGEKVVEVWNSLLEKLGLKQKEEKAPEEPAKCEHKDENNDFKCDLCGAELAVKSVVLDTKAAKLAFAVGDTFDASGVKVVATSEVGSKKELEFTTSEPDMSTTGTKTVTVSAKVGSETKTFEYSISVSNWSDDDLAIFNAASLTRFAPLPYFAGHNMRTEYTLDDEGYLESWMILADDIALADYLEYFNKLKGYNATVTVSGYDVEFALVEVAGEFEGFHDLSDVQVLRLTPSTVYNNRVVRMFDYDEYVILGINEDEQLQIETRLINAMLDGYFFDTDLADGYWGFPAQYNSYLEYVPDVIDYNYSNCSYEKFVLPTIDATTTVTPMNLASMYPLEESLDAYDLAWVVELDYCSETNFIAYTHALVEAGYEYDSESGAYIYSSEVTGTLIFVPEYELFTYDDGGTEVQVPIVTFEFYYIAPATYTHHLDGEIAKMEEIFDLELNVDYDYYHDYDFVICDCAIQESAAESGEELAISIARQLVAEGYVITEAFEYSDQYGQYTFSVSDGVAWFTFYVDEAASEGYYGIEAYVYDDDASSLELSNAELQLQDAFAEFYEFKGVKGYDYAVSDDGSFVTTLVGTTETSVQSAAEAVLDLLSDTSVMVSSEAGENDAWVATFNDVENNVVVEATAYVEEEQILVDLKFSNHRFTTPETILVDFVVAESGAEPSEGDITEEGGKYSYSSSVSGEFASLEAVAAEFASYLPESFVLASSEAGENDTWVQVYDAEELKIRATVVASGEEGSYSVSIVTEYIMPKLPVDDIVGFYTSCGLSNVNIPDYPFTNVDSGIDVQDYSEYGMYIIYVSGSSHDEMEQYKDDLVLAGWTVTGEEDGDYSLAYGDTGATISLVDFGDEIGIAYSYSEPTEDLTPEDAITEFAKGFNAATGQVDEGVYGMSAAYAASESTTVESIKSYVESVAGYYLDGFQATGDWAEDNGAYVIYYANSINTVVEVYVYEETVYVKDGQIVDPSTEGAEETQVIYVEAYSYTYSE